MAAAVLGGGAARDVRKWVPLATPSQGVVVAAALEVGLDVRDNRQAALIAAGTVPVRLVIQNVGRRPIIMRGSDISIELADGTQRAPLSLESVTALVGDRYTAVAQSRLLSGDYERAPEYVIGHPAHLLFLPFAVMLDAARERTVAGVKRMVGWDEWRQQYALEGSLRSREAIELPPRYAIDAVFFVGGLSQQVSANSRLRPATLTIPCSEPGGAGDFILRLSVK